MPDLPVHAASASRRQSARAQHPARASARRSLALLMLLAAAQSAPGAVQAAFPGDDPAAVEAQQGDKGVADLLRRVEQQVSAGQFVSPENDSAMITWGQVVQLEQSSPESIPIHHEIEQFAAVVRHRAAQEEDAGRLSRSIDFVLFADMARQLLSEPPATKPTPGQPPETNQTPETSQTPEASKPLEASKTPEAGQPPASSQTALSGLPPTTNQAPQDSAPQLTLASPVSLPAPAVGNDAPQAVAPMIPSSPPAVVASVSAPAPLPPPTPTEPSPAPPLAPPSPQATFYAARGDDMLAKKDISAARKYYAYAAQAGSARAAMALGQSYDPEFLARLGVFGLKPDLAQAKSWYRTASALGSQDAAARLRTLILESSQ